MLFSDLLKHDVLRNRDKKSKSLILMKPYILKDGDEAKFETSSELVYTNFAHALNALVNSVDIENWKNQPVVFLVFEFNVKDNKDADIGSDYVNEKTGAVAISLNNLIYKKIHAFTANVTVLQMDVDPATEIKSIRDLNIQWRDNENKDIPVEISEMMMSQWLLDHFN